MTNLGVPVPPGFTIACNLCDRFLATGQVPAGLAAEVERAITRLEDAAGRRFGDATNPLLVSVRSGARVSMPGMMETILNLGLNDDTVQGLAAQSGSPRFAYDSYRRLLQMYGDVVLNVRFGDFEHLLAAVVARSMGKCAVVGCDAIRVNAGNRRFSVGETEVVEGDWITLDGATGEVFLGDLPTTPSEVMQVNAGTLTPTDAPVYQGFAELLAWADTRRRLAVRANADRPHDASVARAFGAEGIGLCRTEHMFFDGDRIHAMREMIVAHDEGSRRRALAKLLARRVGVTRRELMRIVEALRESNPMLGHRGCRLGVTYPEITEMQARAIFEAATACRQRGIAVKPEIMIPLVSTVEEFRHQRAIVDRVAAVVRDESGQRVEYLVGTMIELPRAALTAAQIAKEAEFFSFGTNDLTQTTLGLSRDDAGRFLPLYVERGIYPEDPFQVIDVDGVGRLVTMATTDGRAARPALKVGICGEHGGDPKSVAFCHRAGLDYVSCSPFRVPIARLAAAQAT